MRKRPGFARRRRLDSRKRLAFVQKRRPGSRRKHALPRKPRELKQSALLKKLGWPKRRASRRKPGFVLRRRLG
ncbi:hypothetical protein D7X55_36920 [Corallococcus sp. AB049A]|uniref:hypothetical protein n=1 Tax=Corallococcus TaxID=83461 RepID=UPI000ED7C3D1|nr:MULTISPECIES: hypothetical protein [Corallococcus]RKI46980.1 hypothetical protein D7X55_36920 [Corallococcus sp. AB049A]